MQNGHVKQPTWLSYKAFSCAWLLLLVGEGLGLPGWLAMAVPLLTAGLYCGLAML